MITVKDLIEKLQTFPSDSEISLGWVVEGAAWLMAGNKTVCTQSYKMKHPVL